MSYSINNSTDNCYEGTTCLINKFNIRDEELLSSVEADLTVAKMMELEENPINGNFDFLHYKAIHRFIFEDIYDWAGEIRTVNISKKGTDFADASEIEKLANNCFKRLKDSNYFRNQDFDSFVANIVDFYCTTNIIHPFREGNGRTQRVFLKQLINSNGYDINFNSVDTDELMIATIQAANGVTDNLTEIFKKNIVEK